MDIQSITISGRLAAQPELKYTQGDKAVLNMRLASNYYDPKGENNKGTLWVNVVLFGARAETIDKFNLDKGDQIIVSGRLRQDEWQDREGGTRTTLEVIASDIEQVGGGGGERGERQGRARDQDRSGGGRGERPGRDRGGRSERQGRGNNPRRSPPSQEWSDDDIPF